MKKKLLTVLILMFLTIGLLTTFALSGNVPRMTKDELKTMLGNPALCILDVRLGRDFMFSDLKIKGADRPPGLAMGHIMGKFEAYYLSFHYPHPITPEELQEASDITFRRVKEIKEVIFRSG